MLVETMSGFMSGTKKASGGFCGLEIIAPSNRLYHKALQNIICRNMVKE